MTSDENKTKAVPLSGRESGKQKCKAKGPSAKTEILKVENKNHGPRAKGQGDVAVGVPPAAPVPQVSQPAVSPIFQSAGRSVVWRVRPLNGLPMQRTAGGPPAAPTMANEPSESSSGACSADIPVCRFADFPVGQALNAKRLRENFRRPAGRNARETADKNVCATPSALPFAAGQKSSALSVGRTLFPPGGTPAARVPQVSQPAVSPISQSAGRSEVWRVQSTNRRQVCPADRSADIPVCATPSALPFVAGQKSSALSVGRTLFPPGGTPGSTAGGTPAATCAALRPPPKAHSFTFSAFSAVKHPRFRFLDFLDLCVPGIP